MNDARHKPPVRIVLVDDSPTSLGAIRQLVEHDPGFHVVAAITDSTRVLETVEALRPDLLVVDFDMPGADGAEVTRIVMRNCPTPILILTGVVGEEQSAARFRALQAGAVDLISKDGLAGSTRDEALLRAFHRKLRVVSGVAVVRRWRSEPAPDVERPHAVAAIAAGRIRLVAMAASTGGPPALEEVLSSLGPNLPVPIAIVQHLAGEFLDSFVSWLGASSGLPVVKVRDGEPLEAGTVYLAPDGVHFTVTRKLTASLDGSPPLHGCRPSADRLFGSTATATGKEALGVLLTGMGKDGAAGLKRMRDAGAVTIAQDEETSVVFGMPGEAVKLGAASLVLPLDAIGPEIRGFLDASEQEKAP